MTGAPGPLELLGQWDLEAPAATLLAAAIAYGVGVRSVRRWPVRRSASFALGLAALAVALLSGVHAWGDRLQSVHMAGHLLLCLVAAPLLAGGAPLTLALRATHGAARRRLAAALRHPLARVAGHPATGFLALTAITLAVHLVPALYQAGGLLHDAEHVAFLVAGLLFWAPLVGADPGARPASAAARIAWPLAAMAPMGALSAILLTAAPRFPAYERSAAAAGVSPASDERTAAVIMWIGGGLVLTAAILVLAGTALWQEEQRMRRREAVGAR